MPKICPCQAEMSHDSFLFSMLVIDIILNIPSIIGFLLPFIGLMINLKEKNYNSGYFNFYAWFRLISAYILIFVVIVFVIIVFTAVKVVPAEH